MLPVVIDAATLWGSGTYERFAERFTLVYDDLVRRFDPTAGVRWLDLATGTGEVAVRAARAGADVAALDLAPVLLEKAKRRAAEELPFFVEAASGEDVSKVFSTSAPPVKALADSLTPDRRDPCLLVLGTRR